MALLDLILPPACAGCDGPNGPVCGSCLADLGPPGPAEDRFVAPDPGAVVGEALTLAVGAFAYRGALREALKRLKYGGVSRVAEPLAIAALPALARLTAITGPATLVPVPLHAQRQRERGYNQAALLASHLAARSHLPAAHLVVRTRQTEKLHHLDRAARLRSMAHVFAMADEARAPPVAIVVDDILTTSATMEACAAVLRAAGSAEVFGFALAREV